MSTMTIGELVGYVQLDTDDLEKNAKRGQKSLNELAAEVVSKAKAIERQKLALEIDADADAAEREITEVSARLAELRTQEASPKIDAEIREFEAKLARADSRLAQLRAKRVQVEIDMILSEVPDKEINRVRAAADKAADATGRFGEKLERLAPAAMAFSAAGLIPVLMGTVSAISATQGAIGLLPAVANSAAVGIGAMKLATQGFGDALAEMDDPEKFAEALEKLSPAARESAQAIKGLSPAWKTMQQTVQEGFFSGLGDRITAVGGKVTTILGGGFLNAARGANAAAAGILDMLAKAERTQALSTIVNSGGRAFGNLAKSMVPVVGALLDIGAVAGPIFEELTGGATAATQRFADFIREARVSGDLGEWIRSGMSAFGDLLGILGNIGRLIGAVFRAANADGNGLLSTVRDLTAGWADWAASTEGQERLGEVFGALNTILQTTSGVLTTVLPIIGDLIVWFAQLPAPVQAAVVGFVTWGSVIGLVMTKLAPLISGVGLLSSVITGGVAKLVLASSKLGLLGTAAKTAATAQNASALSVVGSWIKMAAGATANAAKTALAWAKTAGAAAASAVADTARAVGAKLLHWATLAITATGHALKTAGAWLLTAGANAATAVANTALYVGQILLQWARMALTAALHAGRVALSWLIIAGTGAINAVAQTALYVGQILVQWARMALMSALHAGRIAIAWALTTGAAAATAVAQMVVIAARFVVQWALMAAGAMARAAIMAAAWLVAMGPIGWIIAAVVGLVVLIIANWDKVKAFTIEAWNAVTDWVKQAWNTIVTTVSGWIAKADRQGQGPRIRPAQRRQVRARHRVPLQGDARRGRPVDPRRHRRRDHPQRRRGDRRGPRGRRGGHPAGAGGGAAAGPGRRGTPGVAAVRTAAGRPGDPGSDAVRREGLRGPHLAGRTGSGGSVQ